LLILQCMFLLKKLLASWVLPPGLFVTLLLIGAVACRKRKGQMVFLSFMALAIYLASIGPVSNSLLLPLESQYPVPATDDLQGGEVYVVLGGGANEKGADIFGDGTLTGDSTARLVAAYRLYRMTPKPILITGGPSTPSGIPEAEIGKRFLAALGVENGHILVETRSRDTRENAAYTKELCAEKGIKKIVLVTSAYHMRRAMLLFGPLFHKITPCPTDFRACENSVGIRRFFPSTENFYNSSIALHERLGVFFYKTIGRKNRTNVEARNREHRTDRPLEGSWICALPFSYSSLASPVHPLG
jgi:uncharacterized SAM-binding protein YcdF (DUF218 family)